MAGIKSLRQGIDLIKQKKAEEGARMIRNALKDPALSDKTRAIAHVWLSVATKDRQQRIDYLERALQYDPQTPNAQEHLNDLLAAGLDEMITTDPLKSITDQFTPPPSPPQPPATVEPNAPFAAPNLGTRPFSASQVLNNSGADIPPRVAPPMTPLPQAQFYSAVTVTDGPNGQATGFFITTDGLMVTSRHAVGTREIVTILLEPNRSANGRVVRSFPHLDLAFVAVELRLQTLMKFAGFVIIPENTSLQVVNAGGIVRQGRSQDARRKLQEGWFITSIRGAPDAGGSPIKDDRGTVIGMLTSASSPATGELYGLSLGVIREKAEEYLEMVKIDQRYSYCPCCGNLARAEIFGAPYCENCGAVLPNMAHFSRSYSQTFDTLYHEREGVMCRNCGSRIGRWEGRCLRCGRET